MPLIHRTRRVTAHRIDHTPEGTPVVRLTMRARFFPSLLEDLNAAEAATLGAALLGFALKQPGLSREYAASVLRQLLPPVDEVTE